MPTTKAQIVRAVQDLPEDATVEDAMERLLLLHKVGVGLRQARDGETVGLDEFEDRLRRRRSEREA